MPRDGTLTRQRILDTAQRLMTEQGYNATSLDLVIAESSSSKGAFFHHFDSKADLARHLIRRYVDADLAQLGAGLDACADIDDPVERVLSFLRFYEDSADDLTSEQSGCLYASVLAEREFTGTEVNSLVAEATMAWRRAIVDLLTPALDAVDVDVDVAALADHLYTTFEGGFILCRTLEDPGAMRGQLRVFRQLVEALLRSDRTAPRTG